MPLLPEITDTDENVSALFQTLKEVGVDAVMPGGLTLRPGQQKRYFMDTLRNNHPEICRLYEKIYREERSSGAPIRQYQQRGRIRLDGLRKNVGLIDYVPHGQYAGRLQLYDEIYVLLTHMLGLYHRKSVQTDALKAAYKKYAKWLETEKKQFSRQRTLTGNDLDSKLIFMLQTGTLSSVIGNDKLCAFLSQVILDRKVLNYHTLKLE
jgi:DNA repair photolyase